MRCNDLSIGWWGLFRRVHRADVLKTVKKNKTPSLLYVIYTPLAPTAYYAITEVCSYTCVRVLICTELRFLCPCLPSLLQYIHPHTDEHTSVRLLQKPSLRQGEQINQLHLCSSNQTRLLSGSSSPTWKGLANQRLL